MESLHRFVMFGIIEQNVEFSVCVFFVAVMWCLVCTFVVIEITE